MPGALVIVICVAMTALATVDLTRQARIRRSQDAVQRQTNALLRGDARIAAAADRETSGPPPMLVNQALIDTRAAVASRDPGQRRRLLRSAEAAITAAMTSRPAWGEAELVAAYVNSARAGGAPDAATLAMVSRSYRDAPLLRHGGMWRVGVGLSAYERLSPETRRQVIEEAVWLARVDNPGRVAIFDQVRGSAGYRVFLSRWHEARAVDADLLARQEGPSPMR